MAQLLTNFNANLQRPSDCQTESFSPVYCFAIFAHSNRKQRHSRFHLSTVDSTKMLYSFHFYTDLLRWRAKFHFDLVTPTTPFMMHMSCQRYPFFAVFWTHSHGYCLATNGILVIVAVDLKGKGFIPLFCCATDRHYLDFFFTIDTPMAFPGKTC